MIARSAGGGGKLGQEQPGWQDRLGSSFEHNMDATNDDMARDRALHRPNLDRLNRLFPEDDSSLSVEDDTSLSVEDDTSLSVEDDASMSVGPPVTGRIFRAFAVFSFLVLTGVGGALAWRAYGDYATDMIGAWALPISTSKPAAPPTGFAELQQQLKSMASDLADMRHTLEQFAANQDQLTRKQEEMTRTQEQMANSIALQAAKQELSQKLSSPSTQAKPVHVLPPPKPAQRPAQLSTQTSSQASSKPAHPPPPQSLQAPDNQ
jgi:hypothetical protein